MADAYANGDPAPMDADVGAGMSRDHRSYFREATRTPRNRSAETTETNPVVYTTAETVGTQFTIVLPLPEPTPGPSRTLATP